MLTFRDIVIIAAVVVLALLWLRRPPRACGCKSGEKKPGDQPAPKGKSCGLIPCAAGRR